ncbi:MAG: DUF131 domain-containing protein [Nitrososphaerota archaeon]
MNWITVIGLILLFVGALITLIAIGLLRGLGGRGRARFGGVILLGPIPIIFGDRSLTGALLIIAAMFIALFIIFTLVW